MRFFTLIVPLVLATLFLGCSKQGSESAGPKSIDLGVVDLTSGQASRHDVGDGKTFVITANSLDASSVELIAVLEKSGKQIASSRVSPAVPDRPLDLSLADVQVHLTPHLK